ncbi:MAG: hypothetical protein Kow0068_08960 [Marinilabiliales bacterium]
MANNEDDIKNLLEELKERNKELNCLYQIDEVLKDYNTNYDSIFNKIIELIPSGYRFTDICKVAIEFNGKYYYNKDFKNTELKQQAPIMIDNEKNGEITVVYSHPVRSEKGIFLNEERKMLYTIADKLSKYISYRELKNKLQEEDDVKSEDNNKKNLEQWLKAQYLNDDEIEKITKVKIEFYKGETICKQGAFSNYIMLLTDGLVKACIINDFNKSYIYKITKPFNFIGLSTLYGDNYYHFSSIALTHSTLYLIEKTVFDQIVKSNKNFYLSVMRWYCRSFEHVYDRMNCIANKQSLGRIADTLLYLTLDIFETTKIPNIITRRDIAELSGLSVENTVRVLSELKKDKIIRILNNEIEVLNSKMLKTISIAG